jgi:peptidyl-prolyl cis-trans isomerase B (cyclophilin B)
LPQKEIRMFGSSKKKDVDAALEGVDLAKHRYQLQLDTTKGPIRLDFWPDVAPGHVKNMLGLAKIGFYDGLTFHRVIPGFVIQGGCPKGNGTGGPGYNVDAEFNSRKHEAGVLSMARSSDPNSAGSQFFLCLEKVPYLDNQYTAFGKTADDESLATVKAIGAVKTDSSDRPVESVSIKSAKVVELPL